MTHPEWTPDRATPEQWEAARFLAERLQGRFNPKRHVSVWDPDLSRDLQAAWYALAQRDFDLYCRVHPSASEVQALVTALLTGRGKKVRQPRLLEA